MNAALISSIQRKNYFVIFTALAMLLMLPAEAYACACCAERGQWYESTSEMGDSGLTEIKRLKFSPSAKIYLDAAGFDEIRGISSTSKTYTLSQTQNKRRWDLKFKDESGKTGTLSFSIPAKAVYFGTDSVNRSQGSSGGEPILYKELRIEGRVSGSGIFARGITADTKIRLVLQGTGNNCTAAEDYKTWNLQVFGSRASYSFYGSFNQPKP